MFVVLITAVALVARGFDWVRATATVGCAEALVGGQDCPAPLVALSARFWTAGAGPRFPFTVKT